MKLQIKAHLNMDSQKALQRLNLESGGRVQQVIDQSVIRFCEDYCPFDTGTLAKANPLLQTQIGSGQVVYEGPYAHYQYYGEVYGPNFPIFDDSSDIPTGFYSPPKKHPTGRDLQYSTDKKPLAGPFWFERA